MSVLYISYNGSTEPIFQSQVLPYLKEFIERNIQVFLITFERESTTPMAQPNLRWLPLKYHKRPRLLATLYDIIQGAWFAAASVRRFKIELIHARSYIPAIIAWIVTRWYKIPWVFDMRGMMADEYADGGLIKRDRMIYKLIKRIEKVLLESADEVVVLTENIQCELPRKSTVIPCCVDTEFFKLNGSNALQVKLSNNDNLIYVGSVGTWYCLQEMSDFYKLWCIRKAHAKWWIFSQSNRQLISNVVGENKDIKIRSVTFEVMNLAMSFGDVGIAFIKPTYSKRASCPTKIGEYLSCGLPIIVNEGIGDVADLVDKHRVGVVVREFTNQAYLEAINKMDNLRKDPKLAQRCRRVAEEKLSLSMGVDRYQAIYRRMA